MGHLELGKAFYDGYKDKLDELCQKRLDDVEPDFYIGIADAALADGHKDVSVLYLKKAAKDKPIADLVKIVDGQDVDKDLLKPVYRFKLEEYAKDYSTLQQVIDGKWSFYDEACDLEYDCMALFNGKRKYRKQHAPAYLERAKAFEGLVEYAHKQIYTPSPMYTKEHNNRQVRTATGVGCVSFAMAGYTTLLGVSFLALPLVAAMMFTFTGGSVAIGGFSTHFFLKDRIKAEQLVERFGEIKQAGSKLDELVGYAFDISIEPGKYEKPPEPEVKVIEPEEKPKKKPKKKKNFRFFGGNK